MDRRLTVLFALVLIVPAVGNAQHVPSGYLFGGIAVPHQEGPTGESPQTYVTAPGGFSLGWQAGGGMDLTRRVGFEVELSATGMMRATEPSRYGMTFNEERRDTTLAAGLRFHLPLSRTVFLEPVAAMGLTWRQGWSRTDHHEYWLTPMERVVQGQRFAHGVTNAGTIVFGADIRLGAGAVTFVPGFRVHWMPATGGDGDWYPGGAPELTLRPALSVRYTFQ